MGVGISTSPTDYYLYTSQRQEAGLGLYFYNARWYDPAIGHFTQADSIVPGAGNPQAFDRYAYVLGNPLRYTDPSGRTPVCGFSYSDPECLELPRTLPPPLPPEPPLYPDYGEETRYQDDFVTSLPQLSQVTPPQLNIIDYDETLQNECTRDRPCIGPKKPDPWWYDIDPSHPDYYVLMGNIGFPGYPGLTGTFTIDRYGYSYGGLGVNYGKSIEAWSVSLNGGYIGSAFDDKMPDARIRDFLTEWAINVSGGAVGGGGITYVPIARWTSKVGWESGVYFPATIGISAVYSWPLGSLFIPGDQ